MTLKSFYRFCLAFLLVLCVFSSVDAKTHKSKKQAAPAAPPVNIPITGTATDPGMADFDSKFVAFMRKWRVPGASLTVMKNDQVIASRGYGWSDKEASQTIDANTALFRIASASKTFTATTILKLVQDGKLKLDDHVFTILNDLQPLNGRKLNSQIYQITVEDLLHMSSGWFNGGSGHLDPMFGPWPKYISDILNPELPASCETTTRFMMSMPLRYKPGTSYAYSNLDYCILGLVINKVTGYRYGPDGYEAYVKQNILAPVGITDMRIASTQLKYRAPNEVRYYPVPGMVIPPDEMPNESYLPYSDMEVLKKNFANGGWMASSKDLATFIQALSQGRILNSKYLAIMQAKPPFAGSKRDTYYTMGGIIYNRNGQRYWIQTGSFTGSNSLIVTKPNGTTIAVIFNYRPDTYSFLGRFRPELRNLIINSDL